MMRCRICGSTNNLKYTPAEIRGSQKSKRLPLPLKEIANAINGNICKYCDLRLENFHKEASPVEINITDDDKYCEMFYKRQYGHPDVATVSSLGSDGDPEVIEVLTSRETTPDITPALDTTLTGRQILSSHARIVDVIDLEDDDEPIDKIIVEANQPNIHARQENLLGCLNLVTSDSESSEINFEPCTKNNTTNEKISLKVEGSSVKDEGETSPQTFPVCKVCGIRFLDTASLQVHMKDIHQLPCPVCASQFKTELELVYHIRQKHREYNGEKLCEGTKCAQDSAMTIRLRFNHSFTFYECQLCGFIESHFKGHKEHIIQNHPDESKSLRDPMMKTKLSCPVCHLKIGLHHVDVCRHMFLKHSEKCKDFIKEVRDLSTLPTKNPKSLKNIKHSARVLAFIGKEEHFYECRLCNKIWGNLQCFSKHLNVHSIDEWTEFEGRKSGTKIVPYDSTLRSKRKTDNHKFSKDVKQMQKSLPKSKADFKTCQKSKQQTTKKQISTKEAIKSKKQDEAFKKPFKQTATNLQTQNTAEHDSKRQKKLKRRSKTEMHPNKETIKVKVLAPLRHFPTQKYDCKYCETTFKGFRKLHLHLMQTHGGEEFQRCTHCCHLFTSEIGLVNHIRFSHTDHLMSKRKRKLTSHLNESEKADETFPKVNSSKRSRLLENKTDSRKQLSENIEIPADPSEWLKEIYQLSCKNKRNLNSLSSNRKLEFYNIISKSDQEQLQRTASNVCCYCAQLFAEPTELSTHEKIHTDGKDMPWIALMKSNSTLQIGPYKL